MKILIADGQPDALAASAAIVRDTGHEVVDAVDGSGALDAFERWRPDLVLLDMALPGLDGLRVASTLRVLRPEWFPIIFLADTLSDAVLRTAGDAGGDDCLARPLNMTVWSMKLRLFERLSALRAQCVAQMAELSALRVEMHEMTLSDGLTGVANRRSFDAALVKEWNRACRSGESLGLCLVEVDAFDTYLERNGPVAGDECVMRAAKALLASIRRAGDMVARYGEATFAVLLPGIEAQGIDILAERMRDAVAKLALPRGDVPGPVTVSVGTAWVTAAQADSAVALLQVALRALQRAGRNGGNQVAADTSVRSGAGSAGASACQPVVETAPDQPRSGSELRQNADVGR